VSGYSRLALTAVISWSIISGQRGVIVKHIVLILIVLAAVTADVPLLSAQGAAAPSGQAAAPAPPSMSAWLRSAYTNNRNYLARAAEAMPEELYGMRPGSQTVVRTFGQLVGHLANYNFLWCSQARGEANPAGGRDFEKEPSKTALVKAIADALAYCDGTYASLTEANGTEALEITQENGRRTQSRRMSLLVLNYGHNNEHYGNIVTYMRIKNMVPPSSAPR
jgi:uncharacterized damage-inducible protein DinB